MFKTLLVGIAFEVFNFHMKIEKCSCVQGYKSGTNVNFLLYFWVGLILFPNNNVVQIL